MSHYLGVLVVAVSLLLFAHARADEAQVFRYRDTDSRAVGSNIARTVTLTSQVPFDRAFSDTTPEQQALVRSNYTDLREPDQPPWPTNGLRAIFKELNRALIEAHADRDAGDIMAVARIDERGDVQTVKVYKAPSDAATAAVSRTLVRGEFKPALRNGKAVAMDFLLSVSVER